MWRYLIVVALIAHGVGHAVGLWMPVPGWFGITWLLPGIGFVASAWGFWRYAEWWPLTVAASATASLLLEALVPGALTSGPYGSAFVFDLVVIVSLLIPATRGRVTALSAD